MKLYDRKERTAYEEMVMDIENKIAHPLGADVLKNAFRPFVYEYKISIHPGGRKVKKNGDFSPFYDLIKILILGRGCMGTVRKLYIFKNFIEVEEYHDGRYGAPGKKREKKKKPTPEQVEKINQMNREKNVRRRLREYFGKNDYFSTMTYRKEERPADMDQAKKDFRKFIRKIKAGYKKRGQELFWIRNIERGTKGGWHVHLAINRIEGTDILLSEAWPHGKVVSQLMYEKGGFADLAAYLTKTEKTWDSEETEKKGRKIRESSYSASKNMPIPKPKIKKLIRWPKEPYVKKGWILEKETCYEGTNQVTGYKYRHYTLAKPAGPHRRI